jgi:hypothetical protein
MKKQVFSLSVLLVFVGLSVSVSAGILLDEPFNYANNAALNSAWNGFTSNPTYTLDTTFGNGEPSYKMPSPAVNSQGRLAYNLGGDYDGSDAQPLEFSFDIYLPTEGASTLWNGSRHFLEMRGYSGNAYGSGGLQSIVAIGLNNGSTDAFSNSYFQGRVWLPGDWYTLNAAAGSPGRSIGWHTLMAQIKTSTVDFYVDGAFVETIARPATSYGFDCVVLGSDLTAGGNTVWVDNVLVEKIPEPATMVLLGLGGLLIRKRS